MMQQINYRKTKLQSIQLNSIENILIIQSTLKKQYILTAPMPRAILKVCLKRNNKNMITLSQIFNKSMHVETNGCFGQL